MSSIIIKGMEMPTSCCQCPVNMYLCKRGYEYLLEHPALYDERAEDCPLVPVPPHGRLIDGDVADVIHFTEEDADGKDFYDGILYAANFISQQPTIIEAEEGET